MTDNQEKQLRIQQLRTIRLDLDFIIADCGDEKIREQLDHSRQRINQFLMGE